MKDKIEQFGFKFTDFNVDDIGGAVKADLLYKDNTYTIAMYDDKRMVTKNWQRVGYEPRFGVDVADYAKANEVIEDVIKEWQESRDGNQ